MRIKGILSTSEHVSGKMLSLPLIKDIQKLKCCCVLHFATKNQNLLPSVWKSALGMKSRSDIEMRTRTLLPVKILLK